MEERDELKSVHVDAFEGVALVIRRSDGKFFQGCGYGGPGRPVPYWTEDIAQAKSYRLPAYARKAAEKYGGKAGYAEADSEGLPRKWVGYPKET